MNRCVVRFRESIKHLAKSFVFAQILYRFGWALPIPFAVGSLSPTDLHIFGLLQSAIQIAVFIVSLNIGLGAMRISFSSSEAKWKEGVWSCALGISLVLCLLWLILMFIFRSFLGKFDLPQDIWFILLVWGVVVMQIAGIIVNGRLRSEGLKNQYWKATIYRSLIISIGSSSIVLLKPEWRLPSIFVIMFLGQLAFNVFLFHCKWEFGRRALSLLGPYLRPLLRYSLPTVIHGVGLWIFINAGQWIGSSYLKSEIDKALITKISLISGLLVAVISAVVEAFKHEMLSFCETQDYHLAYKYIFKVVGLSSLLGIAALIPIGLIDFVDGFPLMQKYSIGFLNSIFLMILVVSYGFYLYSTNCLVVRGSSKSQALSTLIGVSVYFLVIHELFKVCGVPGIILASSIGYIVNGASGIYISNKIIDRI